jgi:hypothetical protein
MYFDTCQNSITPMKKHTLITIAALSLTISAHTFADQTNLEDLFTTNKIFQGYLLLDHSSKFVRWHTDPNPYDASTGDNAGGYIPKSIRIIPPKISGTFYAIRIVYGIDKGYGYSIGPFRGVVAVSSLDGKGVIQFYKQEKDFWRMVVLNHAVCDEKPPTTESTSAPHNEPTRLDKSIQSLEDMNRKNGW